LIQFGVNDLKTAIATLRLLSKRDRSIFTIMLFFRLLSNVLDVLGLLLTGATVNLLAGTNVGTNSLLVMLESIADYFQLSNLYVVVAAAAASFFLAKTVLSLLLNYLSSKFVARVEAELATKVFQQIFESNADTYGEWDEKDLLYAVTTSSNMAFGQSLMVISVIFGEVGLLSTVAIFLAVQNFLALIFMMGYFLCFGYFVSRFVSRSTARASNRLQSNVLASQRTFLDAYQNFRQIKSLGTSSYFADVFSVSRKNQASANARMVNLGYLPRYITEIALMCGLALVLVQRAVFGVNPLPTATLAIFLAGAFRIIASMLPLSASAATLKRIDVEGNHALQILKVPNKASEMSSAKEIEHSENFIEFDDVSYRYAGSSKETISNLNLKIAKGDYLAVVGASGMGKSTFADLLAGFRNPTSGAILVDGLPISEYLGTNPGSIGYLPQHTTLVQGSLSQNIALGVSEEKIDRQRMQAVVEAMQLSSLVGRLPQGLDTQVSGQSGINISGGEMQRVGLARALYKLPRLLILDEPTSALDAETEEAISESLQSISGELALVVIAHRPRTVLQANRVLRLGETAGEVDAPTFQKAIRSDLTQ
jgi:ABC-type multidrug transport system fused ATPase/permease subunit